MATPSRITLRDDASEIRVAGTLGAPDATNGQVLTADGQGNTAFQTGGAGTVTSVAAADTSIVVAGTASAPTIATGTLDVIATDHPPAADWSNNSHKITSLADGASAADATAFHQVPAGGNKVTAAQMNSGAATSGQVPKADGAGGVAYGDAAAGALVLLQTIILAVDGVIDFTSIDQNYADLIVSAMVRGTDAGGTDTLELHVNNDSGSHYIFQQNVSSGTAWTVFNSAGASTVINLADHGIPAAAAAANQFAAVDLTVFGYTSTVWEKVVYGNVAYHGSANGLMEITSGVWTATPAAINRLTLYGGFTTNLKAGSVARLYGRGHL
jgi:hypothetical protein